MLLLPTGRSVMTGVRGALARTMRFVSQHKPVTGIEMETRMKTLSEALTSQQSETHTALVHFTDEVVRLARALEAKGVIASGFIVETSLAGPRPSHDPDLETTPLVPSPAEPTRSVFERWSFIKHSNPNLSNSIPIIKHSDPNLSNSVPITNHSHQARV